MVDRHLYDAIQAGDLEAVIQILTDEPSAVEGTDEHGRPFSFLAAETGRLDLVRYIVEYSRASMNETDEENRNILHYAAASGSLPVVRYFVERVGMQPLSGDIHLVTPYDVAVKMGHREIMDYFADVCGAPIENMYRNPIRTGCFPDPSVVRVGEDYYMVNSSFIYFPCIPVSHSRDLVHWEIIGYAVTNREWAELDGLEGGRGYWAPDISYHDGRFYIVATYRLNDGGPILRRQMVVSAEKPEGPYTKPVFIDEDGIDPSLFWEDDGRCYMLLNRGARIFELSKDATRKISDAKLLYYGDQKRAPEGPHILKYNGYYYLFLAEGGTGMGHRVSVSRSKTLMGVYEPCPFNPIMRQMDERAGLQRCGHGKPVMTQNGQWYMVYLCGRLLDGNYTVLGRETALDPITWTADGWPMVNGLRGPSVLQVKPDLPEWKTERPKRPEWGSNLLGPDWVFPRPPEVDGYRSDHGILWLSGSRAPLSSPYARNIALRRQTAFWFTAGTCMVIPGSSGRDLKPGQDGGMICYYDENTWLKFGVFGTKNGGLELKAVEHIGDMDRETEAICLQSNDENTEVTAKEGENRLRIYLKIETAGLKRTCFWRLDKNEPWLQAADLPYVDYLCDEGIAKGKRFTGAMTGMYVYAGETPTSVGFEYFDYCSFR